MRTEYKARDSDPAAWLVPQLNGDPKLFLTLAEARAFVDSQCGMNYPQPLVLAAGYPYPGAAAEVIRRVISELERYNFAADEHGGKHIRGVWARELAKALANLGNT